MVAARRDRDGPIETMSHRPQESTEGDDRGVDARFGDDGTGPDRHTVRALPGRSLVVLAVVVAVGRWAYSADRTIFHLSPDEPAMLGMARWISGDGPWTMFDADVWRPGYPTLLAPLFWLTDDRVWIVRGALAIGAVIAGYSAVILARLTLRLTSLSPKQALVVAGAVALLPASLSASAYVWAEPLVTCAFLGALWCTLRFFDEPRAALGVGALVWSVAGLTANARLMPLVTLVAVLVIGRSIQLARWRSAAAFAALVVVSVALSSWYAHVAVQELWGEPGDTNTIGSVFDRLRHPLDVLDAAAGQTWYLMTSTALVFGLGIGALARSAAGPSGEGTRRTDARLLLVLTLPLIAVSMVFMSDRPRSDQLIYGRYNDAVIWPVIAVGIAWLVRDLVRESRRVAGWMIAGPIVVTLELGWLMYQLHHKQLGRSAGIRTMISGLQPVIGTGSSVRPLLITVVAIVAFGVILLVAARPPRAGLAVGLVATVLIAGGYTSHRSVAARLNSAEQVAAVTEIEDGILPPGEVVGYRFIPDMYGPSAPLSLQGAYSFLYQWFLPDHEFRTDGGLSDDVGPYVFAPTNDPLLLATGATLLWTDATIEIGLWKESPQE